MRWSKPSLQNSFWGRLVQRGHPLSLEDRMDDIRLAMLQAISDFGNTNLQHLEYRICHCPDLQALWYVRSDLMQALSASQGESLAGQQLAVITAMFEGMPMRSAQSKTKASTAHPSWD